MQFLLSVLYFTSSFKINCKLLSSIINTWNFKYILSEKVKEGIGNFESWFLVSKRWISEELISGESLYSDFHEIRKNFVQKTGADWSHLPPSGVSEYIWSSPKLMPAGSSSAPAKALASAKVVQRLDDERGREFCSEAVGDDPGMIGKVIPEPLLSGQ